MFRCVRNLTPRNISVPHRDPQVETIVLGPFQLEWLADPDAWGDDNVQAHALQELTERGDAEIVELEKRPQRFMWPDMTRYPSVRPSDIEDLKSIILEPEQEVPMMILAVNAISKGPDRTQDMDFLRKRYLPILRAAQEVYKTYGGQMVFPYKSIREKAIQRRIKEIEAK